MPGLAYAMVKNYRVAVIKRQPIQRPVSFAGGMAHNQTIIDVLKEAVYLENLLNIMEIRNVNMLFLKEMAVMKLE
ncbi:MAG: hypothetical protein PVG39_12985 [Desulfobacteraceae bacterium]